jgi:hypothetical protein
MATSFELVDCYNCNRMHFSVDRNAETVVYSGAMSKIVSILLIAELIGRQPRFVELPILGGQL